MLRALIALLLLANLVFFAWSRGALDSVVGLRSIGDREPERMQRQVRPESIRILPASAAAATPVALGCYEAGPFAEAEFNAAQAAAQGALPAGGWVTVKSEQPAVWAVYMGRYGHDAMGRKEDELKRRNVPYEIIGAEAPALAPGFALGRFAERGAAVQALDRFAQQGIRTARVVELVPAVSGYRMRVEQADPALAARLASLKLDAAGSRAFKACAKPAGA